MTVGPGVKNLEFVLDGNNSMVYFSEKSKAVYRPLFNLQGGGGGMLLEVLSRSNNLFQPSWAAR